MNFDVDNKPNCAGLIGRGMLPNICEEDQDPNVSFSLVVVCVVVTFYAFSCSILRSWNAGIY